MADIVTPVKRSKMMSGIRGKNTGLEMILRKGLHSRGFRFRLHVPDLEGKPDMDFPKYNALLFAHGCFWHGHDCHLFKMPQTRTAFWREKIAANVQRDIAVKKALESKGWRIGIVWECAIKGRGRLGIDQTIDQCARWLTGTNTNFEIRGLE